MDSLTIARALHVLAIVHWIGGVSMVTLVILPGLSRGVAPPARLGLFEAIEGRFAKQARISTLAKDPEGTFRKAGRLHIVLLTLSLITVAGAVLGAHGGL